MSWVPHEDDADDAENYKNVLVLTTFNEQPTVSGRGITPLLSNYNPFKTDTLSGGTDVSVLSTLNQVPKAQGRGIGALLKQHQEAEQKKAELKKINQLKLKNSETHLFEDEEQFEDNVPADGEITEMLRSVGISGHYDVNLSSSRTMASAIKQEKVLLNRTIPILLDESYFDFRKHNGETYKYDKNYYVESTSSSESDDNYGFSSQDIENAIKASLNDNNTYRTRTETTESTEKSKKFKPKDLYNKVKRAKQKKNKTVWKKLE